MGLRPSPKGLVLGDRCHGSAHPKSGLGDALYRDENRHISQVACSRARRAERRLARRRWIVESGQSSASVPMWVSRAGWLEELERWVNTDAGRSACASAHVRTVLLLRVAQVLAAHADNGTGRHCAVTNATAAAAADCSARTVTTVRRLLSEAGLAVEIRRGTGSFNAPAHLRRPSIWHLVSRKQPVDNPPVCALPPSRRDRRVRHVGKNSPSGRTRPPRRSRSTQTTTTPRPLPVQKLAAGVIANGVGLDKVHPGHICDALTRSGLDLDAWTAQQITTALNADMRERGWSWPGHSIDKPGAFLASRLRHLPKRPPIAHRPVAPVAEPEVVAPPASAEHRAASIAFFRRHSRAVSG
ncbi:rep protein [soil metagenome]